jgi:hypothetical protein
MGERAPYIKKKKKDTGLAKKFIWVFLGGTLKNLLKYI